MSTDVRSVPAPLRVDGISPAAMLLIIIAALVAAFGVLGLSQATAGVGVLTIAVLLMIAARIAQASAHHKAVMKQLTWKS